MSGLACSAFLYDLPLVVPLRLGKQELISRRGLIIRLSDAEGHSGYGEVAPFPGLHRETVEDAVRQWQGIQPDWLGETVAEGLEHLQGGFGRWLDRYGLCPSLRHGLEMAVLNYLACRRGTTLAALLNPRYCNSLECNALLIGSDELTVQARQLSAAGYSTVKLKVGRQPLEQDIAFVRNARQALGPACRLRLDANRYWDLATAVRFGQAVAACEIEYIEEPLADPGQTTAFYELTGIPVALDESLIPANPATLAVPLGVSAFVLKPAVLGGFERTLRFIELAKRRRLKAVISSVFESGVGLAALANYAAAFCGPVPVGLDTYRWLREDLPEQRFTVDNGRIDVDGVYGRARRLRIELFTPYMDWLNVENKLQFCRMYT